MRFPLIRAPWLRVVLKNGVSYCAESVATCRRDGRYALTFFSSGGLVVVPAEDVASVEFYPTGRQHCSHCDEALKTWPSGEEPEWITREDR